MPRPNWSRPLPTPLRIPTIMDLARSPTCASCSAACRKRRGLETHGGTPKPKAAADRDATQVSIALQMVMMMEKVEYQPK